MWKLNIDKSFETEYIDKMLHDLVTRVKTWKGGTSLYKSFRSELLPDWNRDHPVETDVLEKLLIAKPTEAHALNEQLMKKLVVGYSEADLTQKILPKKYRRRLRILACVFDYDGALGDSKSKSYWLAEHIGHNSCTYCNRQYTFTVSGKNNGERITRPAFDHWFPKSRFPLLSLNLYNLIPCCAICNSGAKGDKVFQLTEFVHPYEQKDDDPKIKFVPSISDKGEWTVVLDRDKVTHPEVDNTIKAFELDRIYDMHGPLEVKELMEFAQAYSNTYLQQIYNQISEELGKVGFSQEDVYKMLFGTESIPSKFLDRPLSKMKHDIMEYLGIIESDAYE